VTTRRREPASGLGEITVSALAELADEIADRLEERLRPRLAQIAAPEVESGAAPAAEWWSARQVAEHYGVTLGFVYQHADELGCVRLGGGRRARIRFDPRIVRDCWSVVGDSLPEIAPQRRPRKRAARRAKPRGYELLDFDREP